MTKATAIQERLDKTRERLLEAIELLSDEALLYPGAIGRLSIADLLHLQTAWEAELVTGLMRIDQGTIPKTLLAALADPKKYDQMRLSEGEARDLDVVFEDYQRVRAHLETWLEEFTEGELTDANQYGWLAGKSLAQLISAVSYEREAALLSDLRAFSRKWRSDHPEDA